MSPALAIEPETTSDPEAIYENVDGEKVVKTMSTFENVLAGVLFAHLHGHAVEYRLGRATVEVMFEMPGLDRDRRPDVAFVSYSKWPLNRRPPIVNAWPVVPDLAAEVVSPTDRMTDVLEKVEEYFRVGVSVVWLILPQQERLYIYTSPTDVRILSRTDELTGESAVPGFRLPLSELFPPPDEEAQ